jgi:prepilin-type N-terminal cleavage/methylation domain-containing protein
MKKAFTLAEVLTTLAIIGVISAVLIPALFTSLPNNNKYLYKSAYKTVEEVVSELINDSSLYSVAADGFKNTTDVGYFCNNFTSKINLIGTTNCSASTTPSAGASGSSSVVSFTTTNGMRWWGFYNDFNKTYPEYENIWVDVDGVNKGTNTIGNDILRIHIQKLGKIVINDCPENKFLTDNAVTTCP